MRRIPASMLVLVLALTLPLLAEVQTGRRIKGDAQLFWLSNPLIRYTLTVRGGQLTGDRLETLPGWVMQPGARPPVMESDAGFALEIMWCDWRAPGKKNNADNPVLLDKNWFIFDHGEQAELAGGAGEVTLYFKGDKNKDVPLEVKLSLVLNETDFFVRRRLTVIDRTNTGHYLQYIWPFYSRLASGYHPVKNGDFGQPVAIRQTEGGFFYGLEYPIAQNRLQPDKLLTCGQEMGEIINPGGIASEWAVAAAVPDPNIKLWFFRYLDSIRVAPLKPYTLYNSWYDLRSPQYPKITPDHVMNEANVQNIIGLIRKNMIEKHGIKLDAFVLDDGWDVYKSDWVLRQDQFPRSLRPVADELAKTGTKLGIWFGPTGGYSFHKDRINWMSQHGYEIVADQLCLAGKNYHALFKKRVLDFVSNAGISYFKWDGIQYSCSQPDHGHSVGLFSRRAVLESVIDLCRSVREKNPEMFLNITSGTWLSPWWVKYANTIWMDGGDYGFSDVPSISRRDSATTYRDFVLYEDFKIKDLWFPIANLMTHGVIKGKLQMLGGEAEPLEKFTDEALLYLARGVSMYELYISPDVLSEGEWDALARSIQWAKDRFPVLMSTFMIGGDPKNREPYGYVHFAGKRGVIALRNPGIEPQQIRVSLSPLYGLDLKASSLVLEQVYPYRWISPELHSAGATIDIRLESYETAIFEIYPLSEATAPLLANVVFDPVAVWNRQYKLNVFRSMGPVKILNPETVTEVTVAGNKGNVYIWPDFRAAVEEPVAGAAVTANKNASVQLPDIRFQVNGNAKDSLLAILVKPEATLVGREIPAISLTVDGREVKAALESQKGLWTWLTVPVGAGAHRAEVRFRDRPKSKWQGKAWAWFICRQPYPAAEVLIKSNADILEKPMPPRPWPAGQVRRHIKLGETDLINF